MKAFQFLLFLCLTISCQEPVAELPDPLQELEGRYDFVPYYYHTDFTPHESLNRTWDIVPSSFDFQRSVTPGTFTLADTPRGTILCDSMVEVAGGYTFRIPTQMIIDRGVVTGAPNIGLNDGVVTIDPKGSRHEGVIILSEKKILLLIEVEHGTERVILALGGKRRE